MEVRHFLRLDDAGLEVAAPAVDLMVENTVLFSIREPDARFITGGENGYARRLDGSGKVHGATVVTDKDPSV